MNDAHRNALTCQVDIDLDLQQLESDRRQADRSAAAAIRERDIVLHALKAALAAVAAAQVLDLTCRQYYESYKCRV